MPSKSTNTDKNETHGIHVTLVSGFIAGTVATLSKQPLQRLKWMRQVARAESAMGGKTTYLTVVRNIIQTEGALGLFRGVFATFARNVPHSALAYTFFPRFKRFYQTNSQSLVVLYCTTIQTIVDRCSSVI